MPIDRTRPFVPLSVAVLCASDTRTIETDDSGRVLADRVLRAGHRLHERTVVPDEIAEIAGKVSGWIEVPGVDVVIVTGGTGFADRDVTPEALDPLLDKRMDGFASLFHRLSYDKIGSSTIQSRAFAGLAGRTLVFALPGSPGACKDAWDGILVEQLDNRFRPCNFVEILHSKRGQDAG